MIKNILNLFDCFFKSINITHFSKISTNNSFHHPRKAFTLAEVLIVVGLIGIVANLTMPQLIADTRERSAIAGVNKAYSVFSQALRRAEADESTISSWGCTTASCYFDTITPYLSLEKDCGLSAGQGCFPQGVNYLYINNTSWGTLDNTTTVPKARMKDGMSFYVNFSSSTCGSTTTANTSNLALRNVCASLVVDVNGNKKPNVLGRDAFIFWITEYGIVPVGTQDDTTTLAANCSNKTGAGTSCAAWALYKNNMNYLDGAVSW